MRFISHLFLCSALCCSLTTLAKMPVNPRVVENTTLFGFGLATANDRYLSPLTYSGNSYFIQSEWSQPLNQRSEKWIQRTAVALQGGLYINSVGTNAMYAISAQLNHAIYYRYKILPNLQLFGGGLFDINFAGKMVGRNVNNPGSVDMYSGLNVAAALQYTFSWHKLDYRLRYHAQSPLLGAMFVPEMGGSYFEMFDKFILANTVHFSAPHNMLAIQHQLLFDIKFGRATWSIGVQHEYRQWHANLLGFNQHQVHGVIGFVTDIVTLTKRNRTEFSMLKTIW